MRHSCSRYVALPRRLLFFFLESYRLKTKQRQQQREREREITLCARDRREFSCGEVSQVLRETWHDMTWHRLRVKLNIKVKINIIVSIRSIIKRGRKEAEKKKNASIGKTKRSRKASLQFV